MGLTQLCQKLRFGPPSLRQIWGLLSGFESRAAFLGLVHTYLPENEAEIKALPLEAAAEKFADIFSGKYFPIYCPDSLEGLTDYVPIEMMGFTYNDYHYFGDRLSTGHTLIAALVESPHDKMSRVPILDAAIKILGKQAFRKVPADGWPHEYFRERLEGTKWEGVAAVSEWICSNTGVEQLDFDWEDGVEPPQWDRETVSWLTEQWKKGKKLFEQMKEAEKLMDKPANFDELVKFLAEPPGKTLMEVLDVQLGRA